MRQAYLGGQFPVFEGFDHMQYQIRDPQGFAALLVSVMERDQLLELPFLRVEGISEPDSKDLLQ